MWHAGQHFAYPLECTKVCTKTKFNIGVACIGIYT